MEWTCRDIAKMIDHSLLRPELTEEDIIEGCRIARHYDTATICCWPSALPLVVKQLKGSDVKPTTVIGFPHGYNTTATKVFESQQAINDGALEIDMVLHVGKLKSGDFDYVQQDIKAVVDTAHKSNVLVKVILENFYLTDELKRTACRLCEEAGADWVKTSTGFASGGATLEDLKLMRESVSDKVQVKAAGGVRTLDMALQVRQIGCTRFGATATAAIMEDCFKRTGRKES
jgi:deoxyribose-phosphate aldolase